VRKSSFPWILIGILVVGYAAGHIVGLVLAAAGLFIAYLLSLRIHPRIRHTGWRSCNGSGEHRGAIFTWTFRKCPGCNGGRLIRLGAGHMGAEHIQNEYQKGKRARQQAKDGNVWR
jgi:hypothetical protein